MDRVNFLLEAHAAQHIAVVIGDVVKSQHLAQFCARQIFVRIERHARLGDDLDLARVAPGFDRSFAHPRSDFFDLRGRRHVDEHTVGNLADELGHLRPEAGEINRQIGMTRLPRQLKALAGLIDLALVFDPFAGGDFAHDVDIFTRAPQRPVEYAIVPCGNGLVGDAEAEQQPSTREILQRRRLNPERDRAAAIDVINRGPELER